MLPASCLPHLRCVGLWRMHRVGSSRLGAELVPPVTDQLVPSLLPVSQDLLLFLTQFCSICGSFHCFQKNSEVFLEEHWVWQGQLCRPLKLPLLTRTRLMRNLCVKWKDCCSFYFSFLCKYINIDAYKGRILGVQVCIRSWVIWFRRCLFASFRFD